MSSAGCRHGAVEYGGRCATSHAVPVMRPLEVVELHVAVKASIERRAASEVVPAIDHAPVLGEDRLLQAFDEAVRPGVPPSLPAALSPAQVPIRALEDPARAATSMLTVAPPLPPERRTRAIFD